jgi:hypothetical protein
MYVPGAIRLIPLVADLARPRYRVLDRRVGHRAVEYRLGASVNLAHRYRLPLIEDNLGARLPDDAVPSSATETMRGRAPLPIRRKARDQSIQRHPGFRVR